jgi:hypothetical protein
MYLVNHLLLVSFICIAMTQACGGPGVQTDAPPAQQAPPPVDDGWTKTAPLVAQDCGGCHNGSYQPALAPGAVFKASGAKARLAAGTMPPAGSAMPAADKSAMLAYLGG